MNQRPNPFQNVDAWTSVGALIKDMAKDVSTSPDLATMIARADEWETVAWLLDAFELNPYALRKALYGPPVKEAKDPPISASGTSSPGH